MTFSRAIIAAIALISTTVLAQADEPEHYEVQCHIETKKDVVKETKTIEFKLFCGNSDLETVLLPEQFFTHQRIFANSLRFINSNGDQLCLMDRRYSKDKRLYRYVPHRSGEEVMTLRFPDKYQEHYRMVACTDLERIQPHEILEMENLFNIGGTVIPKGEYDIYLALPDQWQTSRVGHHNLILTQTDNKKTNVGEYDWWHISKEITPKHLTIK